MKSNDGIIFHSRCCDKKSCGNRNETPSDPVVVDRYFQIIEILSTIPHGFDILNCSRETMADESPMPKAIMARILITSDVFSNRL